MRMWLAESGRECKLHGMKPIAQLLMAQVLAVAVGLAAPASTTQSLDKAAAQQVAPKTEAKKKKEEPPPKIEGITIERAKGGYLGFQLVGSNIVLSFYNAKKKKIPLDVTRAIVRWANKYKPGDDRAVLNAGNDGKSLTSEKVVPPPHNRKFFLGLYVEGNDEPVEFYTVDYRD